MKQKKEIFIIPFAGGSINSMIPLAREFELFSKVHILELPGRGKRILEPLLTNVEEMVEDLYAIVRPKMNINKEYCFFGHSMGSLLGILLVKKILEEDNFRITHFFASGRGGPSLQLENKGTSKLPSNEFREKLRELGGSPDDVLENEELMELFEPIIRADFKASEEFEYKESKKLDIHIMGFYGTEEKITMEDMLLWQSESNFPVQILRFEGNHFFLFNWIKEVSKNINNRIKEETPLNSKIV